MKYLVVTLTLILIAGCIKQPTVDKPMVIEHPPAPAPAPPPPPAPVADIGHITDAKLLAGAVISSTEPLVIEFGDLFQSGAAIPYPAGEEILPAIVRYLKKHPGPWVVAVGAFDAESQNYAARLAKARAELIKRYLERQGVDIGDIEIIETVDQLPLQIRKLSPVEG